MATQPLKDRQKENIQRHLWDTVGCSMADRQRSRYWPGIGPGWANAQSYYLRPKQNICLFPICCHFNQWVGGKFILFYFLFYFLSLQPIGR